MSAGRAADRRIILAFHAPWSAPCRDFERVVEVLAARIGTHIEVRLHDLDENAATAHRFDVSSLPTLLVFRGELLVGRVLGARPVEELVTEVQQHLS